MANQHRGYVEIKLDRPRTLKFTFNALAQLEDVLNLESIIELETKKLSVKIVRAMLWAALLHEDENLTLEDAGRLMDQAASFVELVQSIQKAYQIAMSGNEPGKEKVSGGTGGK